MSEPASSEPSTQDASDPRPVVALPKAGLSNLAIAAIGIVLAIILFVILDSHRVERTNSVEHPATSQVDAFPSPPPLDLPPEPPVEPVFIASASPQPAPPMPIYRTTSPVVPQPSMPVAIPAPASPIPATPKRAHQDAPAVVFDQGPVTNGTATAQAGNAQGASSASGADDAPIKTTIIRNHTTIMPIGTVIPAVLETPIDSTRPGLVRAVVSEDARGFDGKRVLIPRGSRLIGEYTSDIRSGQKRVLVTWTRLIRPDGVAIRIGSPAADPLGGSGIPGRVNTYFLQRFGAAVLQSALQVGVNLASRPGNGSVIVGLPSTTSSSIGQDLIPSSDLKPRIRVREGASLTIFVAHDLDFGGTPLVGSDRPS